MPHAGKDHGKAGFVGGFNYLLVADRPAGLNNFCRAPFCCRQQPVGYLAPGDPGLLPSGGAPGF